MPKSEANVESEVVQWCRSKGYLCLKLALIGSRGFPDRTIVTTMGDVIFVELKKPNGGKLSPQQEYIIEELASRQRYVAECRSLEEVQRAVAYGLYNRNLDGLTVAQELGIDFLTAMAWIKEETTKHKDYLASIS